MKNILLRIAPLMVFLALALFAYYQQPIQQSSAERKTISSSEPSRSPHKNGVSETENLLRDMEKRIHQRYPEPEIVEPAEKMNRLLACQSFPAQSIYIGFPEEWAETAPEEMYAWLIEQNLRPSFYSDSYSFYADILFSSWAKVDPSAALSAALRITEAPLRAQSLLSTLAMLSETKPEQAKKVLQQNEKWFTAANMGNVSFYRCGTEFLWEMSQDLSSHDSKYLLQAKMLQTSSAGDWAVKIWNNSSITQQRAWVNAGFCYYSEKEKAGFTGLEDLMRERVETTRQAADAEKFINCFGETMAQRDLAAAVSWSQMHLKGKQKQQTIHQFFEHGIKQDLNKTIDVLRKMPEGYMKKSIANKIGVSLSGNQ